MKLLIAKTYWLSLLLVFLSSSAFATSPMQDPTSSNYYNIRQNQGWKPSISAPGSNGSGTKLFVVAGHTNWRSASWSPTSPGSYTFYVAQKADSSHHGNTTDPIQGELQVNFSSYTVTVMPKLSVNLGSGGGDYPEGDTVSITAIDPIFPNTVFDDWISSHSSAIADINDPTTTFTMQSANSTATGTFKGIGYSWNYPSTVDHQESYNVSVSANTGGFPYVTLRKDGSFFAGGWIATQGNSSDDGPDNIYYSASYTDSVTSSSGSSGSKRVRVLSPPNEDPDADFNFTTNNLNVSFDGGASNDPDGFIQTYSWNYGDGSSSGSGEEPNHTYSSAGTYAVILTVWDNQGAWDTRSRNVTVSISPPGKPTSEPATNVAATSFRANWDGSTTEYRLDVSTNSNFSPNLQNYNNLTVNAEFKNVTGLAQNTTYYYQVRAVGQGGTSVDSDTITVTTGALPPPVPAVQSATLVTPISFQANWNSSTGAMDYLLDVSTASDFSTYHLGYENLSVSGVFSPVTNLSPGTTYYYRVSAVGAGGTSAESTSVSVLTGAAGGSGGGSPGAGSDFGDPSDGDGDGMPTGWENNYSLNTSIDDSLEDLDGDGILNLFEYLYGTDPSLATSKPISGTYRVGAAQPFATIQAAVDSAVAGSISDVVIELVGDSFVGSGNDDLNITGLGTTNLLVVADGGGSDATIDISNVSIARGQNLDSAGHFAPMVLHEKWRLVVSQIFVEPTP